MYRKVKIFVLLCLTLLSCSTKESINWNNNLYLKHTYSVYLKCPKDYISFCKTFKDQMKWEGYIYIPNNLEDADTVMNISIKRNLKGYLMVIEAEEKTGNRQKSTIFIKASSLEEAAKVLAHNFHWLAELPPDVEAVSPYYHLTDPSTPR